jgi:HK97 family phage portal protein
LYDVLTYQPNPNDTPAEFKEKLMTDLLLHGNSYCKIVRFGGKIKELWRLPVDSVDVKLMSDSSILYTWKNDNGTEETANSFDKECKIWHIKLFSTDNVKGVAPVEQLKDLFGEAGKIDQFWTKYIDNGCTLSGIIKSAEPIEQDKFEDVKNIINEEYTGSRNTGKVLFLDYGLDYKPMSEKSLSDSQFIQTKLHIMKQIAGVFKVPLNMLGIMEGATYNNVEQQQINFLVHCLSPYLNKIEERITMSLLKKEEREKYTVKFLTTGLLKLDTESRYKTYKMAIENGILNRNEIRDMEELSAYTGGDKFIVPLNMALIDENGQIERVVDGQNASGGDRDLIDNNSTTDSNEQIKPTADTAVQEGV